MRLAKYFDIDTLTISRNDLLQHWVERAKFQTKH